MPVTTTAKRALRSSEKKRAVNKLLMTNLDISLRRAKKSKSEKDIKTATSFTDRATKKKIIHKNKAARIKSQLSKLLSQKTAKKAKLSKK